MTQYSTKFRNEMRFRHQAANHSLRLCQRSVGTLELLAGKLITLLLTVLPVLGLSIPPLQHTAQKLSDYARILHGGG